MNDKNLLVSNESNVSTPAAFGGYLYYFHYIKGVAKYTSNFTVSTSIPSVLSETVLLLTASGASGTLGNTITNTTLIYQQVPRFYYGDAVPLSGDNGYWLLPSLPNAKVYFLQAPLKINCMGQAYMYMEIDGLNCIDETSPYNLSKFTAHTNETNGIVNSSFAKIPIPTTPISQWFDNDSGPYKYFNPPAERIRKLKERLNKMKNSQILPEIPADRSQRTEQNMRPSKKQIYKKYNFIKHTFIY